MLVGICGNYLIIECVVIIEYVAIIFRGVCKVKNELGSVKGREIDKLKDRKIG